MTSSSPLTSFTFFPFLPTELRLQIYRHACAPRVVTLTHIRSHHHHHPTFHCATRPPVLLHISHESRAEGLRLYVRCSLPTTATTTRNGDQEDEQRYFFLHPQNDTLYLPRPAPNPHTDPFGMGYADWARDFAAAMPQVAGVVKRLAVDYVPPEVRRPWEVYGKVCLLRGCDGVEEGWLVISRSATTCSSFSSSSSSSGKARGEGVGQGEGYGAEVEFVDPARDDEEIMTIMERVKESWRYELGDAAFGAGLGKVDGLGQRVGLEMGLELIPKAKVVGGWGRTAAVTCAS
ncbi:hypothetical protein VTI74DRAFT_5533 [Chaetomium olivicolor]